jgi:hypothetical protein
METNDTDKLSGREVIRGFGLLWGLGLRYFAKDCRAHPVRTAVGGLFLAGVIAGNVNMVQQSRYDRGLYLQIKNCADVNRDGNVTSDEWAIVYQEMGIRYDSREPSSFTRDQMEDYLKQKL